MTDHDPKNSPAHTRTKSDPDSISRLSFFATPQHECNYLPERQAVTLFADPHAQLDNHTYSILAEYGFRRSGRHIYRPSCPACNACIPVRIPVDEFSPNRSQRRNRTLNRDLVVRQMPAGFVEEHHRLYLKYMNNRHPGGGMEDPAPEKYMEFLTCDWAETRFVEFRLGEALLAVAVVDEMDQGLSAVYTFFDPHYQQRALGTYAVLWEIEECRRLGLPWLYLGYWIEECPKMQYKSRFRPLDRFDEGHWYRM